MRERHLLESLGLTESIVINYPQLLVGAMKPILPCSFHIGQVLCVQNVQLYVALQFACTTWAMGNLGNCRAFKSHPQKWRQIKLFLFWHLGQIMFQYGSNKKFLSCWYLIVDIFPRDANWNGTIEPSMQ